MPGAHKGLSYISPARLTESLIRWLATHGAHKGLSYTIHAHLFESLIR